MKRNLLFIVLVALFVPFTALAQQSLPYSYGFENNDVIAEGWTLPSVNHTSTNIAAGGAIHAGNKGFQFFYGSNPVYDQYLISPELSGTTNGVAVSFWYKNYNTTYNATFQVGYSSTDTELESFEWLYATTTTSAYWQQSVAFNCPAGTKYVAIKCKTNYYFFVDDISFTEPSETAIPYSYGFESSNTELTEGWTTVNRSQYTYVATGGAIHNGSKGFEFWGTTTATYNPQYLISPELDGTQGVAYTFYYKSYNNATHQFQLGYSTTSDLTSDAWVWSDTKTSNGDWMQLDEQVCPAGTKYVAVKYLSTSGYFFIDDFTFSLPPEINAPTDLTVTAVSTTSATLTWNGENGYTYNVGYKAAADADWTSHTTGLSATTTEITGLTAGTSYQVRVQSDFKGQTSGWTSTNFITECEAASLPYTYGFEDSESNKWNCWEKGTGITIATGAAIHDGAKGLQFLNANGSTFTSPELEGTENGVAFYFYYGVYSGTQTFQVGYFDGNNWTWTADIEASNVTNSDGWLQYINEQIPENTTQVAIKCTSSGYFFVDDINIAEAPDCQTPETLEAQEITATSAKIVWTGGSGTYGVEYQVADANGWETAATNLELSAGPFYYIIENLAPHTTYKARVQSICGETSSEWIEVLFTTACEAAIPYEYGFEEEKEYECWATADAASNTKRTTSSAVHGGEYVFQFFNNADNAYPEQYLYVPELAGNGTDPIALSFWHRNWASHYETTLQVGHKADEADAFTWENVSVSGAAWANYYTILPANTKFVALKCSVFNPGTGETPTPANSWFLLDDFSFAYAPKTFVIEGAWDDDENWLPVGAPTADENVAIMAAATINSNVVATANNITIGQGGSITLMDGAQLKHMTSNLRVAVEKEIKAWTIEETQDDNKSNGWYFISNPLNQNATPTSVLYMIDDVNEYDLYRFDAAAQDGLEWINYKKEKDNFNLVVGHSYLYAKSTNTTLRFEGTTFMSNSTTPLPMAYTYDGSSQASFNGWMLVGNPYICNAYISYEDANHNTLEADFYVMNSAGDGYKLSKSSVALAPCQGAFICVEESGKILYSSQEPTESAAPKLDVALSQSQRGGSIDQVRVRFGNGRQMPKLSFREGGSTICIPQADKDYAVVRSNGEGELPINFKAEKNGTYTLSFDMENVAFDNLRLIDNLTGVETDLLAAPSYTFTAKTTDYASRFRLVFDANDVDENGASASTTTFAYFNGSEWVVNASENATVQVVDVMGRIVVSTNGVNTVATNGLTAGVYMLRLVDGNNVKTQKIVVR